MLRWCAKKAIHFIGDEVYGLSEFRRARGEDGFVSALSVAARKDTRVDGNSVNGDSYEEADSSDCQQITEGSFAEPTMNGRVTADGRESEIAALDLHDSRDNADGAGSIDLSRVHVIWSLSKDLGCSGLRIVNVHRVLSFSLLPQAKPMIVNVLR